jgi:hypothetical protein
MARTSWTSKGLTTLLKLPPKHNNPPKAVEEEALISHMELLYLLNMVNGDVSIRPDISLSPDKDKSNNK